jgi:hypothetical protein
MQTFEDLHQKLNDARFKFEVFQHLIEYLDASFMPHGGVNPERVLLTEDDRIRVPTETFEYVINEVLADKLNMLSEEIKAIKSATVVVPKADKKTKKAKDTGEENEQDQSGPS